MYGMIDRCQCDDWQVSVYDWQVSLYNDWQVYEDSVELQSYFIQQRDELCRRGEVLLTPALNFTAQQFTETIEDERREQTSCEQQRDEDERKKQTPATTTAVKVSSAQVSWCWRFLNHNWSHITVFFIRGSAEPKGSAGGIQGFRGTAGAQ